MISRREVVTAGVLGTLAAHAPAETAEMVQGSQDTTAIRQELNQIEQQLQQMRLAVEFGMRGPSLSAGFVADVRDRYTVHLRSSGKFPDFMEIGTAVFYDIYDWHVRYNQQVQITRISEQRFAIQFMFTQLIVRFEQDPKYLGVPFDRG